ncbi:MAG: slipin family protein [Pseudomonadota bacterium]
MLNPFHHFNLTVFDNERAVLRKDGRYLRLLGPGRVKTYDPSHRLTAMKYDVVRSELDKDAARIIEVEDPTVAKEQLAFVRTGPSEVAIVRLDGEPTHLIQPNTTRVFWKSVTDVDVDVIDVAGNMRLTDEQLGALNLARNTTVTQSVVGAHETALLLVNGELREVLAPGRHAFWNINRTVEIRHVDLRPQLLEVTAQEILTKDRVGIRVTLSAFYRVTQPETAGLASADLRETLYRLVQFAIREAVAGRTLDDILAARAELDQQLRTFVASRVGELGVAVVEIGVKDIILPGDVRELLNRVVEAEKTAKANLIRRQEETAATRSLLNTSRLMENNPLLLRLKELEALEKLVEKVGRIDLHAGNGGGSLDALLNGLYALRDETGKQGQAEGADASGDT